MKPEGPLLCSQELASGPYLSQINRVHTLRFTLMLSEISGSQGDKYEDDCVLGCFAV
jgi:hypothetical protein